MLGVFFLKLRTSDTFSRLLKLVIFFTQQDQIYKSVKRESNETDVVYKALSAIMDPGLSKSISWKGTRGTKIPLVNSFIVELVQCKLPLLYFVFQCKDWIFGT